MKKLLSLITVLMVVLGCSAQGIEEPSVVSLQGFEEYFASLAALAGLVVVITGYAIQLFKQPPTKLIKQLISWGVSLLISLVGWLFQWGIFTGAEWYSIFAYGLAAGLVANGIFDVKMVQLALSWLKISNKVQKKPNEEAF